ALEVVVEPEAVVIRDPAEWIVRLPDPAERVRGLPVSVLVGAPRHRVHARAEHPALRLDQHPIALALERVVERTHRRGEPQPRGGDRGRRAGCGWTGLA